MEGENYEDLDVGRRVTINLKRDRMGRHALD
jgi:hypothetical protein